MHTAECCRRAHPDSFANLIVENIVYHALKKDKNARVDVDALIGKSQNDYVVYLAGNITCTNFDILFNSLHEIIQKLSIELGYNSDWGFDPYNFKLYSAINEQAPEINKNVFLSSVGDSRPIFGYSCNETQFKLPLSVIIAENIKKELDNIFLKGELDYIGPDGKVQVTVCDGTLKNATIAVQHLPISKEIIERELKQIVIDVANTFDCRTENIIINGSNSFTKGGPGVDKGCSNTKLMAYGEALPHGGGGPWGKDGTKPEKFAFLKAREIAKQFDFEEVFVNFSYSMGHKHPFELKVNSKNLEIDFDSESVISSFKLRDPETIKKFINSGIIT